MDAELPQVVIQVLVAEVDLNNTEEFGVEIGLQTSPVLCSCGRPSPLKRLAAASGIDQASPTLPAASITPRGVTVTGTQ